VQAHGPGVTRNFPGEAISELPVSLGEERKQRSSSRYIGVCWVKASSSWRVSLWDPQTKCTRTIGYFASEEDAARAYDCAAVQARGPGAKRNFPGDATATSEMPVPQSSEQSRDDHSPDGGAAAQTAAVKVEARPRRSFTVGRVSGRHHAVKTEPEPHDGGSGCGPHAPAGPAPRAAGAHVIADALQPELLLPPRGQAPSESVTDLEWICAPPR
jgi:hypothetical protein